MSSSQTARAVSAEREAGLARDGIAGRRGSRAHGTAQLPTASVRLTPRATAGDLDSSPSVLSFLITEKCSSLPLTLNL